MSTPASAASGIEPRTAPSAQVAVATPRLTSFALDVRAGLGRAQKKLAPKYLYDDLGSSLFEAITRLPEYGVWRAECGLLAAHASAIAARSEATRVIELGSGSANKTRCVLNALSCRAHVAYCTIDVSPAALAMAQRELGTIDNVRIEAIEAEYLAGLELALRNRRADERVLVLFLGSSLGNFDYATSRAFLRRVRAALFPDDCLLLGIDLDKPVTRLLAAYADPLGVTAAFNLNLLVRMNRELGADFVLQRFRHQARFNALRRDMEMHIESLSDQRIRFPAPLNFSVFLRAGETIHSESSHKYTPGELGDLLRASGFANLACWYENDWRFVSALYRAV